VTSFHHQPEAQHPKSSAIHKLGRPITPSLSPIASLMLQRGECSDVPLTTGALQHDKRKRKTASKAVLPKFDQVYLISR